MSKASGHFRRFIFLYASLAVLLVWAATPLVMRLLVSNCYTTLGQAGDMFGSVNALFSGITIVGLIITIIRQQEEIQRAGSQFTEQKTQAQKHHDEQKEQAQKIFDDQKNQVQNNFDDEKELLRKQADFEIINSLYSDLIQEINSIQYRRIKSDGDKEGILYTGIDAIYHFDEMHHASPNSVLNQLNWIMSSFESLLLMTNQVRYKYEIQKDITLTQIYLLFYSKMSWPVGHSIYANRRKLKLTANPDYPLFIKNYTKLTKETQNYLEAKKKIGKPVTDWMVELLGAE